MTFNDQIFQAIKVIMPANAEINVVSGVREFNVRVSWKLNDDPERPNKMSKTILICVSSEAADDFANMSAADQRVAYERVSQFLSAKLAQFDPQHNVSRYDTPPVVRWVITSEVLNG